MSRPSTGSRAWMGADAMAVKVPQTSLQRPLEYTGRQVRR